MGPGLLESIYQRCLLRELELRGIPARSQELVVVEYKKVTKVTKEERRKPRWNCAALSAGCFGDSGHGRRSRMPGGSASCSSFGDCKSIAFPVFFVSFCSNVSSCSKMFCHDAPVVRQI
jgi:hypothetical protein